MRIAPSILSADFAALGDAIARVEAAGADLLHVDVMDGHFVPNLTLGPPVIESIRKRTRLPLDVHLMIEEPERWVDTYVKAGADYLTLHVEACAHLERALHMVREAGARAGAALNPAPGPGVLSTRSGSGPPLCSKGVWTWKRDRRSARRSIAPERNAMRTARAAPSMP